MSAATDAATYAARGRALYTTAQQAAEQANPSGDTSLSSLATVAMAMASDTFDSQALATVAKAAAGVTSAAGLSAVFATTFGAEAGPVGAYIGAVVAVYELLPHAGANDADSRPAIVQMLDPDGPSGPPKLPEPLTQDVIEQVTALARYEQVKSQLSGCPSSGFGTVTQAMVDQRYQELVSKWDVDAQAHADATIAYYEDAVGYPGSTLLDYCGAAFGFAQRADNDVSALGYVAATAAVQQWPSEELYAYLLGYRDYWRQYESAAGLSDPSTTLDTEVGWIADRVPVLPKPDPLALLHSLEFGIQRYQANFEVITPPPSPNAPATVPSAAAAVSTQHAVAAAAGVGLGVGALWLLSRFFL